MSDPNVRIILSASDQTRAAFDSAKNNSDSLSTSLVASSAAIAAAAVAAAAGLALMVKNSIDAADAMNLAAQKAGTTTEMLSGLKYAAELSDVSFESLQKSLGKLSVKAYEAATSGGASAEAFRKLGVSVRDADGNLKDSGTLLTEIADKMNEMPEGIRKSALAQQIFGKSWQELIPLLNEGGAGIEAATDEAKRMGLIFSGETSAQADKFKDDLDKIKKSAEGMAHTIAKDALPALVVLMDEFAKSATNGGPPSLFSSAVKLISEQIAILGVESRSVFRNAVAEIDLVKGVFTELSHGRISGISTVFKIFNDDLEKQHVELEALHKKIRNPPAVLDPKKPKSKDEREETPEEVEAEEKAAKSLEKLLEKSQQFAAELTAAHQTAYEKNVAKFIEMQDKLTAAGAAGNDQRIKLQQAFAAYTAEESAKQEEELQKKLDKEAEQNIRLVETQQEKFTRMREMAEAVSLSDEEDENLRFEAQMRALEREAEVLEQKGLFELESKQKFMAAKEALEAAHTERLRIINLNSDKKIVDGKIQYQKISLDSMGTFFGMAKGLMNSHSRAAFEIGKAAAIAETLINTYKSATSAFSAMAGIPIIGPALGAAAAAAAVVSGMAQISAIQSSSFDSGGSAGGGSYGGVSSALSGGAATPNYPSTPDRPVPVEGVAAQAPREVTIIMSGDATLFTAEAVREQLIPAINEAAGDGVLITVRAA